MPPNNSHNTSLRQQVTTGNDEQTEERFIPDTMNSKSNPASFVNNYDSNKGNDLEMVQQISSEQQPYVDVYYQNTESIPTDSFVNDEGFHDGGQNPYELEENTEREIGIKTTERNPLAMSETENTN